MKNQLLTSFLLTSILCAATPAHAEILVVTTGQDNVSGSLRDIVNKARKNDKIIFGITGGATLTVQHSPILIDKDLTIDGGSSKTQIAGDKTNIFLLQGTNLNIRLGNLKLINGHAEKGGAIQATVQDSSVSIYDCSFIGNSASIGGAISFDNGVHHIEDYAHLHRSNLTVFRSEFLKNTADFGGAISMKRGLLTMDRVKLTMNTSSAAIIDSETAFLDMANSIVAYNAGMAIYNPSLSRIAFSTIYRNESGVNLRLSQLNGNIIAENGTPGDEESQLEANLNYKKLIKNEDNFIGNYTPDVFGMVYENPTPRTSNDAKLINLVPQKESPTVGLSKNCMYLNRKIRVDFNGNPRPASNCTAGAIEPNKI